MGRDGCSGNIYLKLMNLDLSGVKSYAMPSVVSGCNQDSVRVEWRLLVHKLAKLLWRQHLLPAL